MLGIESWLSAPDHLRILDAVGSRSVQVYYDLANSTQMGYDILAEIRQLGRDRICEFHAKENGFLLGQGRIDFPAVRKAMDDIGYSGWIQIEGAVPKGSAAHREPRAERPVHADPLLRKDRSNLPRVTSEAALANRGGLGTSFPSIGKLVASP